MKKILLSVSMLVWVGASIMIAQGNKCKDLFISEYMDGPNKNKVLEIYNPSDVAIDLSTYSIKVFNNGAPTPLDIPLAGTLQPKETYVVAHPQADANILNKADQTDVKMNFDGNDAIVLNKGQSTYIDKIGEIGVNPGAQNGWSLQPSGSTKSQDLRRKFVVDEGEIDWNNGKSQWETHPANAIQNIKDHDNTCNAVTSAEVNFKVTDGGQYTEDYSDNIWPDFIEIEVEATGSWSGIVTAYLQVNGVNFNCQTPSADGNTVDYWLLETQLDFTSPGVQSVRIQIIDDAITEADEFICIDLSVSGDAYVGTNDWHQIQILDNDAGGIDDIELQGINIYPSNPLNRINIENTGNPSDFIVSIYNAVGQVVYTSNWKQGTDKMDIDVSNLISGLYTVKVLNTKDNRSFSSKFVK